MSSETETERPIRVGMISLGCAKNLVDAEIMLGSLIKGGVEIVNDAEGADVVIVNTCSFIDSAQEESVDAILESNEVREANNRGQGLIVSGCLPQRFREELPRLMPEVDVFMGIDQVEQISDKVREALEHRRARLAEGGGEASDDDGEAESADKGEVMDTLAELEGIQGAESDLSTHTASQRSAPLVDIHARPDYIPDYETPRFRLTPQHFAYVKIAEGCNHPCSFCIIPRMRGSHRSRALEDIVNEAKRLVADGVKELNLISQDSTYYGMDLRPDHRPSISSPERFLAANEDLPADVPTLCALLRALNDIPGDFWIRLLYTHPAHWTDELIRTIAECPKVARYVDMPLQHIHGAMLERMRRETSQEYIEDLIRRIREGIPGIALRTTFIVGFPGETEAYFQTLLDFIRNTRFERLGVFTYSKEDGTRAGAMESQLDDDEKDARRSRAMEAQQEVARSISEACVGKTVKVLIEGRATGEDLRGANVSSWEHGLIRADAEDSEAAPELEGEYLIARGEADAPDIDGRIYVRGSLPIGEFAEVRVVGHTDYDLIAEPA